MSDFNVAEYDADQIKVSIAGIAVAKGAGKSGYGDGEFLSFKKVNPSFKTVEGTDGSIARSKMNSRLVQIELTLLQTSATNDRLTALWLSDENSPNGQGIGSFVAQDLQGTTKLMCTKCWISQPPDMSFDRTAKGRKWMLEGVWSVYTVGSN